MFSRKVTRTIGLGLLLSVNGCSSSIDFKPEQYSKDVEKLEKGAYMQALTDKRDIPVLFTLDTETGTIQIDEVDSSDGLNIRYSKNAQDERYIRDCVIMQRYGGYDRCNNMPSPRDEDYLSLYHKVENHVGQGLAVTLIGTPICLPFGTLGAVFSFSLSPIGACFPDYSERIYSDEREELIGSLVDRKLTQYLSDELAKARRSPEPQQLVEFLAKFAYHPEADGIKTEIVGRYREIGDKRGSTPDYLVAESYSNSWDDIEAAQRHVKSEADQQLIDDLLLKKSMNSGQAVKERIIAFYRQVAAKSGSFADHKKVYAWTNAKSDLVACAPLAATPEDKEFVSSRLKEIEDAEEAQREQARREQVLQKARSDVKIRSNMKHGRIGERYVPAITKSYMSTDAEFYVGGERKTIESQKSYTIGGENEDVTGYTLVYGVHNSSNRSYIAKLSISGTSTTSNYKTVGGGAWEGEKRNQLNTQTKSISFNKTLLLRPDMEYKDQLVVGESEPRDLEIKIVEVEQVDDKWVSGFMAACNGKIDEASAAAELLPVIKKYLSDSRADAWSRTLSSRKREALEVIDRAEQAQLKQQVSVTVEPKSNYDPDFENDVTVHVANRSQREFKVEVTIAGKESVTIEVPAQGRKSGALRIQGVRKDDLAVTALRVNR